MAKSKLVVEDDYIDMDISSCSQSNFLCYSISSPPHSREFEFQMSIHSSERETTISPADDLFYKGKLLPLHLPPRLRMVEMLLQNSIAAPEAMNLLDESIPKTAAITTTTNTAQTTPSESCIVSPASSCCVSGELNPQEYFYKDSYGLIHPRSKKSWLKRFKLIRQSTLKASRAYLKTLFSKPEFPGKQCSLPRETKCSSCYLKVEKKNPRDIQSGRYPVTEDNSNAIAMHKDEEKQKDEECGYRRSFSGILKRHSIAKSSSASSSCSSSSCSSFSSANSSRLHGPPMLKRSNSMKSEVESSIQGAIAYCKESQQVVCARKSASDIEFYSLSASRIAYADQD